MYEGDISYGGYGGDEIKSHLLCGYLYMSYDIVRMIYALFDEHNDMIVCWLFGHLISY